MPYKRQGDKVAYDRRRNGETRRRLEQTKLARLGRPPLIMRDRDAEESAYRPRMRQAGFSEAEIDAVFEKSAESA